VTLDSSAIIAIMKREPDYEDLLSRIDAAEVIRVGAPTVFEVSLVLARASYQDPNVEIEAFLEAIDAEIVPFTEAHYKIAAQAYQRFGRGFNSQAKLNFGDCLSYATASLAGDTLLFVGTDFAHTDLLPA
jgi:ribonuclease VapC